MMRRLGLTLVLVMAVAAGCLAAAPTPAGLEMKAGETGASFDYRLPGLDLVGFKGDTRVPFQRYQIEVPDLDRSLDPGLPALPGKGFFLALPPGARARLKVEEASFHDVPGVWIDPPPTTRVWPDDGEPAGDPQFAAVPDPEVYATDAFVPEAPVGIGEPGVARDVDFVRVDLRPFSWNPAKGVLRVYDRLRFRVEFDLAAKTPGKPGEAVGGLTDGLRGRSPSATGSSGVRAPAARPAAPSALSAGDFFVNGPVPPAWSYRHEPEGATEIRSAMNPAANGEAYKIEVSADGIHRVTFAALASVGFPAAPAPFSEVRLELRGQKVPIGPVDADRDGGFGPGDAIEFFGVANPERWTTKHVYWLTRDGGGRLMRWLPAFPAGSSSYRSVNSVLATARAERDENFFSQTALDPDVWDPWVYDFRILSDDGCSLPGVSGMDVDLDVRLLAPPDPSRTYHVRGQVLGREIGSCNPDSQQIDLSLNGAAVGSVAWLVSVDGMLKAFSLPFDVSGLSEGANRAHLVQPVLPGKLRWSFLDWLEIEYQKRLYAENGVLDFRGAWPAGATFYAGGFGTGLVTALDVRSDGQVDRLDGVRALSLGPGQPVTLAFALAPEPNVTHRLVLAERSRILIPQVTRDTPSDLGAQATAGEYAIISHAAFKPAVQELADYRASQGMSVQLVDVQDVYDEYSWGNVDARAIRDFLTDALANWAAAPLYVLLVGDSTYDFKDHWTPGTSPFFIPHLEVTAIGGGSDYGELLSTDSRYQTLVGSDAVPDLLLGRLAVQTPLEVSTYLAKLRAYEAALPQPWNGSYLLVLDDDIDVRGCPSTATPAEINARAVMECYLASSGSNPDLHEVLVRVEQSGSNALILAARNQGISFSLYLGHGSSEGLGQACTPPFQDILSINDLSRLVSPDALPLSISISCNTAAFAWDDRTTGRSRCMGESFVTWTGPGTDIGFIGSTAGVTETDGRGQMEGILDGLFRDGSSYLPPFIGNGRRRAGAIHFAGQIGLLLNPRVFAPLVREWTSRTLALHGDPAAMLQIAAPPSPPRATCP